MSDGSIPILWFWYLCREMKIRSNAAIVIYLTRLASGCSKKDLIVYRQRSGHIW